MLVKEVFDLAVRTLSQNGFEDPRLNVERLLSQTLNLTRTDLYLNFDRPLDSEERLKFKENMKRRLRREPLQYIVGETEFMSLPFRVNPNVLIPRPETELLVETVLDQCKKRFTGRDRVYILDVGTGSGCIAVSLARYLPTAHIVAIDISPGALATAVENAKLSEVIERIEFLRSDIFDSPAPKELIAKFDAIVSNPPYIVPEDFADLPAEVRNFEPEIALRDGGDGLRFFRRIAEVGPMFLRSNGFVAVEAGFDQVNSIKKIFSTWGLLNINSAADLNGIERVVSGDYEHSEISKADVKYMEVVR